MARYSRYVSYSRYSDSFYDWKPYVPVAARRLEAERELAKLRKNGQPASPVRIGGRTIAHTFWGKAWCGNLERYSDFANRLPRGRTYVRNGSVVDLQIARGAVTALVRGSDLYRIQIAVKPVPKTRWQGICRDCTGAIDSLIELLQGRLSARVMNRICEPKAGLFPEPRDVSFECSCPDWASMCKHVAATLYGVGARLDERPELLFLLRGVDQEELIAKAGTAMQPPAQDPGDGKVLDSGDLSEIFGIEIAGPDAPSRTRAARGKPKERAIASPPPAPSVSAAKPTAHTRMSATERAVSRERIERISSAAPKPAPRRQMSAAKRSAVSERMRQYWEEQRRRSRREKD